jgi:hypothetical protein
MAKRDLSRTVLEGGRGTRNQFDRNHSHAEERAAVRAWLGVDPDAAPTPPRRPVPKHFSDKLAASFRWLASHAGEPWDDVRSELFRRFDTRTLAGRHIVFEHMLYEVRRPVDHTPWFGRFVIDDDGILRVQKRCRRRRSFFMPDARFAALADGRAVAGRGSAVFWFVPVVRDGVVRWRQDRRLKNDEAARYRTLAPEDRERLAPGGEAAVQALGPRLVNGAARGPRP